ncbi:MAG: ATP-binding cassette domain-containing protein [Mesorhizobium sp.]|nr:MAG: ATP-binding cassette domain-containing protein [Mesorhizobium sp.]
MGPSGSGKSTLLNLVAGFESPDAGKVLIGGIDVGTAAPSARPVSMVFQENNLFAHLSVEGNVGLGRSPSLKLTAADRHSVSEALGRVGLAGKEKRLPRELSGGERQRIAIARAVLKDAPILVLDEATSALDVETEDRVKEAIDELRRDRTTFIIAHRLTTVRDADLVVFMDKGKVVEYGGFTELSLRNGRFAALLRAGGLLNDEEVRRLSRPVNEAA